MTKRLDYIATTPVGERQQVMPRIYCKDGLSLSVQASSLHYVHPRSSPGPWTSLEVAFVSDTRAIPDDWQRFGRGYQSFGMHDHVGINLEGMTSIPVHVVPIDILRAFIEAHGGELTDADRFLNQANTKLIELRRVQTLGRSIWDLHIEETLDLVPHGCSQDEANRLILQKYAKDYRDTLAKSVELFDEWRLLMSTWDVLEKQERAELERAVAKSKP